MNKVLEFQNISHAFSGLKVIKDISLSIFSEEIICLLGPSGSGKTTLFKIAADLISPDRGRVVLSPGTKGYVFQEPRLLPWKTVRENIKFIQKNKLSAIRAKDMRENLLKLTGLKRFGDSYPAQLSGGMKQRIEIIKALSINPDVLLMDEPFKSIDTQTRINFQQMLLRFKEEKKLSIFIITHNPEEAVMMADRIYVISQKPARVIKVIKLEKPQYQRTLKDNIIYKSLEEIIELFRELVGEFRWEKKAKTSRIIKEITGG
ncbi:MAG: ABC transporter ATP-binding protein [Bacillota bacterium]